MQILGTSHAFPRRLATGPALVAALALLGGCERHGPPTWSGYAEGDFVYVSAPIAGTLSMLQVEAGQKVARGQALFALDAEPEQAAREEAQARLASARFQAADAEKGRRAPEVAVSQAQLAQARAQLELARREFARKEPLVATGAVSREDLDAARGALQQAQAKVAELQASLQVAHLPSRGDQRGAAEAQVEAARQALREASWREQQKRQAAPADAVVSDTFFRPGEFVNAGQPVVALLPPANLKARFFVGEGELAHLAAGQRVRLSCDGCGSPIEARVSFIAPQPEYTPPVIYSNADRRKLVFLVEARPVSAADRARLKPGQPLQVQPQP